MQITHCSQGFLMDINFSGNAVELIQLALAPVFLLVGIGQMLNVMTGRLARIIDRARWFEEFEEQNPERITSRAEREIESLRKRMRFANWSITFLTGAAVTICIAVILLVVNGLVSVKLDTLILGTFIFSLVLLTGGLITFLVEVSVATATLRISRRTQKK